MGIRHSLLLQPERWEVCARMYLTLTHYQWICGVWIRKQEGLQTLRYPSVAHLRIRLFLQSNLQASELL